MNPLASNISEKNELQSNLSFITLFIAAYEYFSGTVMKNLEGFLMSHENPEQLEKWQKLKNKKIDESGNRDLLKSCMLEFVDMKVITKKEYDEFIALKQLRHKYVHETTEIIFRGIIEEEQDRLSYLIALWEKVENWWINEINFPGETNDFDKASSCSLVYLLFLKMVQTLHGDTYTKYCKNKKMLSARFNKYEML